MSEDARTAPLALNIHYFIKWTLISVVIGLTVGAIGTVFGHGCLLYTSPSPRD